jgi:ketosteroid isomerase-like protein
MSRENAEIVRSGLAAFARGDRRTIEAFAAKHLDQRFELHTLYPAQAYRGTAAPLDFLADAGETWDRYALETEEVVDLGEHVLAVARMSGRGAGSGVPVEQSIFVLWSFEGAKALRAETFASRSAALEAARLSE